MRGDVIFRVYGIHGGRETDAYFGAYYSREKAEAAVVKLAAQNWAARHDKGFVIREHVVETDFEIPSRSKPRDRYLVRDTNRSKASGEWVSSLVEVFRRLPGKEPEQICAYERNYSTLQTFEPFRRGNREFALISRDYTRTAVLDLASGEVIAEETEETPGSGFCPVGFYVPDWWDLHDDSIIPGSEYWDARHEWPVGDFGFVWGCYWGDDSSWKVQYLDLRRITEGVIARDARFGYVELATNGYVSPCFAELSTGGAPSRPPAFIEFVQGGRRSDVTQVRFAVELEFNLDSGRVNEQQLAQLARKTSDPE